jgi:hypothetical protein
VNELATVRKNLFIEDKTAKKLEKYSEKTTINQSKIVDLALKEYLKDKEVD